MVFYMNFMVFLVFFDRMPRLDVPDDFEMLIQNFDNLLRQFQPDFHHFSFLGGIIFSVSCLDLVYYKV